MIFNSTFFQFYNVNGLQKLSDILTENPSWSITHLVAYFNLVDYISNPKVLQCIDYADHINCMSPFQVLLFNINCKRYFVILNMQYIIKKPLFFKACR